MRLILLGPPGAGKGTLAGLLKKAFQLDHISTGDLLREEIKNKTELGIEVKRYIDNGELVPDEVVTKLIENRISKKSDGYMLDGFPRTRKQAEDLDHILRQAKTPLDYVLYLESTVEIIIQRLCGRRVCKQCGHTCHVVNRPPKKEGVCDECGGALYQRPDDKEETIRHRIDVYVNNTAPIIKYYDDQKKLRALNGDEESEDLVDVFKNMINEDAKPHNH